MRNSKYLAEFLGTGILVTVVVGSGTMATKLSSDVGIQLLINTIATVLALGILITLFLPLSGAHFNPVVTLSEFAMRRMPLITSFGYIFVQLLGGVTGAVIANLMFKHPAIYMSDHLRSGSNIFLGEVVATAGLLLVIQLIGYQKRTQLAPIVVAAWIGSAYFFTSSTSFANPAVTLARSFSNTFAGIALRSVPLFVFAQGVGAAIGVGIAFALSRGVNEREFHE